MGNVFEDVFVKPVKKVFKEVVVRPAKKIAAEAKREASWAVEQEKDWLKSDVFKVAAGTAAVAVAGPIVLPTLAGAGAAVVGAAAAAIPTIVNVLGGVSKIITAKEQTKQAEAAAKIAELQAAQPGSNIADQLADLLAKLASLAGIPPGATPPIIEPGRVQEAQAVNWPLLGLLGVGAYLLLKR